MLTFLTALFDKVAEVVEEIYAESHVRSHEDHSETIQVTHDRRSIGSTLQ